MFVVPVDTDALGPMLSLGVEPKTEFNSTEQKRNKAGVPQWSVTVFLQKEREALVVTVASPEKPAVPQDGHPVVLVGLEAGTYGSIKGTSASASFYFVATGVRGVQRAA